MHCLGRWRLPAGRVRHGPRSQAAQRPAMPNRAAPTNFDLIGFCRASAGMRFPTSGRPYGMGNSLLRYKARLRRIRSRRVWVLA